MSQADGSPKRRSRRIILICLSILTALGLIGVLAAIGGFYALGAYYKPDLPTVSGLEDLELQVPLRIYTADGVLMREYGAERRAPLDYDQLPQSLIEAVLAAEDDRFYGNYDGILLGFELKSPLIAPEGSPPPPVDDPVMDFVPAVRSGRRAPHVWIDDAQTVSVLDGFGTGYSLVLGADVDAKPWADRVDQVAARGLPISIQALPQMPAGSAYANDGVALVEGGVIAGDQVDCALHGVDDKGGGRRTKGRLRITPEKSSKAPCASCFSS